MKLLLQRIPATLYLCFAATLLSVCIALPLGIISAIKRGTAVDRIAMSLALFGQSVPGFWAGIMLILLVAVKWGIAAALGYGSPKYVILPAISLAFFFAAATARLTRSNILDVLDTEFVRYARLKGVPERIVILRHVLRNAFISILNIVALQTGMLFGGAVIAEFIFSWPGIGRLSLDAIYARLPCDPGHSYCHREFLCAYQSPRRCRLYIHGPQGPQELKMRKRTEINHRASQRRLKLAKVFRRIPKGASLIILGLLFCAICAPLLAPHDPIKQDLENVLAPPFWEKGGATSHILGTDNLGRDILSRIIYGSRISAIVGFAVSSSPRIIGTFSA